MRTTCSALAAPAGWRATHLRQPLRQHADVANPGLAQAGDYGGPTQTIALLPGSPAIANGAAFFGITTDQRGFSRTLGVANPDIGAFQSTLVVNTTTDASYGILSPAGELSLRQAVGLADFLGGTQTITFNSIVFAAPQTITLTAGQLELSATGGLETIAGPSAGLTIGAGGTSRVFQIEKGVTASLSGLTITGGVARHGGGVYNYGTATVAACTISGNSAVNSGGGLMNVGTITLTDCTFSGNYAVYGGGGLANSGTVTITGCTISGNRAADGNGGGLANSGTATLTDCTISCYFAGVGTGGFGSGGGLANSGTATLTDCAIRGNSSPNGGGGLANFGTVTITGCTISGNAASQGGGVHDYDSGTATLTDCTISGNAANEGGGVNAYGPLTLIACTVSGNSAGIGGGLFLRSGPGPRRTIFDTIVAGNVANTTPNLSGRVDQDRGYNLIGDGDGASGFTAAGDQVGTGASPIDQLAHWATRRSDSDHGHRRQPRPRHEELPSPTPTTDQRPR